MKNETKIKCLITFLIFYTNIISYSQTPCQTPSDDLIFAVTEIMPIPNITYNDLEELINQNVDFGSYHLNDITRICISFYVNCKGENYKVEVVETVNPEVIYNISDLLKSKFSWTPALQRHNPVDIKFGFSLSKHGQRWCFDKEYIKYCEKRDKKARKKLKKVNHIR